MNSLFGKQARMSIWGSGLLAVDVVVRAKDEAIIDITAGGTCGNVLAGLATFGWDSQAKGRLGSDEAGNVLDAALLKAGVDTSSLVYSEDVKTPVIIERFGIGDLDDPKHRFEWACPVCKSPVPRFRPTPISLLQANVDLATAPLIFFFDRPTPGNLRLAKQLRSAGTIIMFEPPRLKDEDPFDVAIASSDIVKVAGGQDKDFLESKLSDCSLSIITYGADGLEYKVNGFQGVFHDWQAVSAIPLTRSIDACGSGDWLTVGFLHALFAVQDLIDSDGKIGASLKYGQALAALNCLLPGARGLSRIFTRTEIAEMVGLTLAKGLTSIERKIIKRASDLGELRDIHHVCTVCASMHGESVRAEKPHLA